MTRHGIPTPARGHTIGEAARASGVKVPTIRYYEEIGLLPAPPRSHGNRRSFSDGDMDRLAFIRHARELGFEIDAIRTLLALRDDPCQSCQTADGIARRHLEEVDRRIAALRALKVELTHMIEGCGQGHVADCRVIGMLADHGQCHGEHESAGSPLSRR
jgi:DNA-binding transcriptional MerR regulator